MDKCLWCGGFLDANLKIHFILSFKPFVPQVLCGKCQALFALPVNSEKCCDCGRFQTNPARCQDCEQWLAQQNQLINQSFYPYHGIMQTYFERYKFKGDYRLRHLFQPLLKTAIQKGEIVVPIPLTSATMETRHFNQVIGLLGDLSYVACLVAKPKHQAQSEKGRVARLQMQQPFCFREEMTQQIYQQAIVLVDDVYTTGTTLHYAAQLLKEHGAKSVRSITLAR